MSSKPSIVFIPGAWHSPKGFEPVMSRLEQAGYYCIGIELPTVGASPPKENFDEDVKAIRDAVEGIADSGGECVVVMHSYGGVPGTEAMKGLSKSSRSEGGKTGGVIRLFYMCSFALPEGASAVGSLGGEPLPWFGMKGDEVTALNPNMIFYNDLPEDVASGWSGMLKHHSFGAFKSEITYAAYKHIPSTYLVCTEDLALPLFEQEAMISGAGVFEVERCDAGHSPFLSQPDMVVKIIRKIAGETS